MKLRSTIREVQQLENDAAEKAGMRFLLLEDDRLFGKDSRKYISEYIGRLLEDIRPEIIQAAQIGKEFAGEVLG
jgi:hypothetical protein